MKDPIEQALEDLVIVGEWVRRVPEASLSRFRAHQRDRVLSLLDDARRMIRAQQDLVSAQHHLLRLSERHRQEEQ